MRDRTRVAGEMHQVVCQMPDCPAHDQPQPVMLRLPPVGYALTDAGDPMLVKGVLSVRRVVLASENVNTNASEASATVNDSALLPEGSAAGGVLLALEGGGFSDVAARMHVELVRAGAMHEVLANCSVLNSSSLGSNDNSSRLTCRTQTHARPQSVRSAPPSYECVTASIVSVSRNGSRIVDT